MGETITRLIAENRSLIDLAQAISAVVNLVGWSLGLVLLAMAWRTGRRIEGSFGFLKFRLQEEAVRETATAARAWNEGVSGKPVDMGRIRETVAKAFDPARADEMIGKSILWVDDNPRNNELVVRALKRMQLGVELAESTEAGLTALARRHFHLVISDMGRGDNMRAGYELLAAIRGAGNMVPFLIFAGSDTPEFRREAAERGAQLSTNDMVELMDAIIAHLGK
jgi:CheY-like chemotaxis protein